MAVLWDGQSGCGVSDQAFVFDTRCINVIKRKEETLTSHCYRLSCISKHYG